MTLRLNLFAAWMVVLIAEAVGVGSGLGQVVMMARNTFNASLVFFTMTLIGLAGFAFDQALRWVQRRVLWWVGPVGRRGRTVMGSAIQLNRVTKIWNEGGSARSPPSIRCRCRSGKASSSSCSDPGLRQEQPACTCWPA